MSFARRHGRAARAAFGAAVPCAFRECGPAGGPARARDLRRRRAQRLHSRLDGLRRGVPRLRQRRLAGYRRADRPAPAVDARRMRSSACTGTIATARFPTSREKAGLGRSVWAPGITVGDYDNDGFDDLFITCWGQNILFHNNGDGTFSDVTEKAGLIASGQRAMAPAARGSITIATASWISSSRTTWSSTRRRYRLAGRTPAATTTAFRSTAVPSGLPQESLPALPQQRRRHVHRCQREVRHLRASSRAMP